jgi:ATPase family associated with various cellular activities (AAA)
MSNKSIEIKFGKTVTLAEAEALITSVTTNRFHLMGEPGIGKSSMLERIATRLGMDYAYIDVPNLDLGDIAMPVVDHESKTTRYYPNARFKLQSNKPVCIMLDEYSKGADPVKNMLHPLFEVVNPRLGDVAVPPGSIVFSTGNLSSDGVGDGMKAHTKARLTKLVVRKPSAEEWLAWAVPKGIAPEVCAWVDRYPQVLASYIDGGQGDNPYIFNPRSVQDSFVCPRTLELASNIVSARSKFSSDALIAAMSGVIGEAGSRDLQAFIAYSDQLPTRASIIADPKNAAVPSQPGACAVVIYSLISAAEKDNFSALMEYVKRFDPEWQATFCIQVARTTSKQAIAFSNKDFSKWVADNQDLL